MTADPGRASAGTAGGDGDGDGEPYGAAYADVFDRPAYHRVGEALARWALGCAPPGAERALDLGCGAGAGTRVLCVEGGLAVTGVEASAAMLARARPRLAGLRATLVEADLRAAAAAADPTGGFGPGPYDLVAWLFDGVNHLLDPAEVAAVLAAAGRLLAPGGVVCLDAVTPATMAESDGTTDVVQDDADCLEIHRVTYDPESRLLALRSDAFLRTGADPDAFGRPGAGLDAGEGARASHRESGGFVRVVERRVERAHTLAELEGAATAAGLRIAAVHGDTDGGPYDAASSARRLLVLTGSAAPGAARVGPSPR